MVRCRLACSSSTHVTIRDAALDDRGTWIVDPEALGGIDRGGFSYWKGYSETGEPL